MKNAWLVILEYETAGQANRHTKRIYLAKVISQMNAVREVLQHHTMP